MSLPEEIDPRLHELALRTGYRSDNSLRILRHIVRVTNPARILELGTGLGASALYMAEVTSARIVTVDDYRNRTPEDVAAEMSIFGWAGQIELVRGDTRRCNEFLIGKFDFVFFDASHELDALREEYAAVQDLLTEYNVLVFDDWMPNWLAPFREQIKRPGLQFHSHYGLAVFADPAWLAFLEQTVQGVQCTRLNH